MGFTSGSVTFRRFTVHGYAPLPSEAVVPLTKLATKAMGRDSTRTADRSDIGWITGQHILDSEFTLEKNVIGDGLLFAMRIDTNKPPADLVRSYQRQNEQAMLEASGREFLSRAERREAREQAVSRADTEARGGAFHRMKQVPAFWDLKRGEVYLASTGLAVGEAFAALFARTFDHPLVPVTAGSLADAWPARTDQRQALDNCQPAYFVQPPDGSAIDDFCRSGPNKDYLGLEWLLWLWFLLENQRTDPIMPLTLAFEKFVHMECPFGLTGHLALKADDVIRLPESRAALAEGKRPVRIGMQLAAGGDVFGLNLRGDTMHYSGVQLHKPEDASNSRAEIEDRLEHLRTMIKACDGLYSAFLHERLSERWPDRLCDIRYWIDAGAPV